MNIDSILNSIGISLTPCDLSDDGTLPILGDYEIAVLNLLQNNNGAMKWSEIYRVLSNDGEDDVFSLVFSATLCLWSIGITSEERLSDDSIVTLIQ